MISRVNEALAVLTPGSSIKDEARNGYIAIDLYKGGRCIKMLHSGTAKECYTFARGMLQTAYLVQESPNYAGLTVSDTSVTPD
jgi:hypothetical protein